ncbi:hypothetical protein QTP86_014053 [Hemibagrus guttatus]|nr:hypothetical protein QTP86_014053 [Hemibagrus guttatus]
MTPAVSSPPRGAGTVAMRKEASELRKSLKPLMEKRRRARINDCLNQLKNLIVPLMGKDNCRYSKLEKADILELTVKFLADVPKTPTNDVTVSYREGYEACLQRVSALQSLRSSSPSCRTCSARTSTAPSPLQRDQRLLSHKWMDNVWREKRASVTPERSQDAPQAAAQPMWRPW